MLCCQLVAMIADIPAMARPILELLVDQLRSLDEPVSLRLLSIGACAHAMDAGRDARGGPSDRSARVLRFCMIAARWNSSRAPERPLSLIRSKPWCTLRCAKRISTLALVARLKKGLRAHEASRHVAGILMDIATHLPCRHVRAALQLQCTDIAVEFGGAITEHIAVMHGSGGVQHLVVRADVDASSPVPAKVATVRTCHHRAR
jgi:hypothetical protein